MEWKMEIKCGNAKEMEEILELTEIRGRVNKTVTVTPVTNYGSNVYGGIIRTRKTAKKQFKLSAKKRKYFRDYYKRTHKKK